MKPVSLNNNNGRIYSVFLEKYLTRRNAFSESPTLDWRHRHAGKRKKS